MEVVVILTWIGMLVSSIMNTPEPMPTSTIVLVDNGFEKNAIIVETKVGSVLIDKTGGYVNLTSKDEKPSEVKIMSQEQINQKFKNVIDSAPLKPIKILLYFKSNSNELTDESKRKLPEIFKNIKDRAPADVSVIGHTDTKGSQKINNKLSLKRAKSITKWILEQNIDVPKLKSEGYGENDLLIKTADNVSEAKNRRVEIFIK